ncbi:MAG TPA: hypothetical protein DHR80_05205 [Thalassospira lucentensis]|uniref:Uncharacterized protein n=1 Tax=Thalassospira lucentensis TaxID=168935 RepID=A0A3D5N7I8_9PROT|nr:hypothetical protein [Thalassospira lucentensis]HCW66608.1 hypothetical protein [Thalassospira lucentensis]|tara:strand:- start:5612 stop:5884 length:273 start_codon:yes stop_codon:yes gene_type:complete
MVKRREQKNSEIPNVDPEKIEAFASRVDEVAKPGRMGRPPKLPGKKRDYKAISLPFNQAEWEILEEAAEKSGRSKNNFIRWAIAEVAKSI